MPTFLHHAAEIAAAPYRSGVRWSGMSDELDLRPTAQQLAADREAQEDREAAFEASPAGQLMAAFCVLEFFGYDLEAARAAWSRAEGDLVAHPAEAGRILAVMTEISGPTARDALSALGELLQAKAA